MKFLKLLSSIVLFFFGMGQVIYAQMGEGQILMQGASLGINGQIAYNESKLVLEADGDLKVYSKGLERWSSHTGGSGGNVLRMQNDGNLVLYKNNGTNPHDAVWSSNTHEIFGTNAEKLKTKYLGFKVLSEELCIFAQKACYGNDGPKGNGETMWTLCLNSGWAQNGSDGIKTGSKLPFVAGPSFDYTMKPLFNPGVGSADWYIYEFTKGSVMQGNACDNGTGGSLWFEDNGNLVLYWNKGSNYEEKLWESGTSSKGGNVLRMKNDGNLVMYKNNGTEPRDAVWSTGTHNQTCPDACGYNLNMRNRECWNKSTLSIVINKITKYGSALGENIWKMYGN